MSDRLSRLWKRFRQDKWLLLLCFVLAFVVWHTIRRNISLPIPVANIPVQIDVPDGWAVLDKSLDTVDIRFMGSREDIRDLSSGTLRVVIPVPNPERGKVMSFTFNARHIKGNPSDAKVDRYNPTEIEITLDKEIKRTLPVKAATSGTLPEGLEIESIVCKPATVSVRGAEQQLAKMENIHTEPIDLNNRQDSFKENVRIALPPGGRLQAEPDRVSVEFLMQTRSSTRELNEVPVRVLCGPGERRRMSVQPLTISITVSGQQQRINQLQAAEIFAYVNCTELTESTGYDLPVNVQLPSGLQVVRTVPPVVHVEIDNAN